jgi:hypothetical protein
MFKSSVLFLSVALSLSACQWDRTEHMKLETRLTVENGALLTTSYYTAPTKVDFYPGKVTFKIEKDDSVDGAKITLSQYQNGVLVSATIQAKGYSDSSAFTRTTTIPTSATGLSENINIRRYQYLDSCLEEAVNQQGYATTTVNSGCRGEVTYHIQFGHGAVLSYSDSFESGDQKSVPQIESYKKTTEHPTPLEFDHESSTYLPKTASFELQQAINLSPRNSQVFQWQAGLKGARTKLDYFAQTYPNRPFCFLESTTPLTEDQTLPAYASLKLVSSKVVRDGRAIEMTLARGDQHYRLTCSHGWKANANSGFQYTGIPSIYEIREAMQDIAVLNRK